MTARPPGERSALAAGLLCYTCWGLLPLLLRAAGEAGAGAWEIVAWRTVWSVPFALAVAGVVIQTVAVGGLPWISISLAVSFCGYGVVRKKVAVDAQTGLLVECLLLMWPAAAYLIWLAPMGVMAFGTSTKADLLL